jgi:hypothetical protein
VLAERTEYALLLRNAYMPWHVGQEHTAVLTSRSLIVGSGQSFLSGVRPEIFIAVRVNKHPREVIH